MPPPDGETTVFESTRARECRERALVLMAVGIPFAIRRSEAGGWRLVVPPVRAADATRELEAYAAENANWPRRSPTLPSHRHGFGGVTFYLGVLVIMHLASHGGAFGQNWFGAGRMQSALLREGEIWRTVTALTLHVNATHLIGNLILGSLLALFASRQFGSGVTWFCILLSGAAGNLVSGWMQGDDHSAVGASTAVFAALGLVGAFNWRHRRDHRVPWAVQIAPLVVAAVVLSFTGSGGERTDVLSHLTGFAAGVALGAYGGGLAPMVRIGRRGQALFAVATIGVIALSWVIALLANG